MPFTSRTPTYLTPEQRYALTQIPADLSDREIARQRMRSTRIIVQIPSVYWLIANFGESGDR